MKKHLLLVLLLAGFTAIAQQKFEPKEITGTEANAIWQGAEHVWLKQENTVPAFIQFRAGSEPDELTFFTYLKKKFQLPSNYSFRLISDDKDDIGWQHKRYQVTVNGVVVDNGIFILHLVNGKVKKFNGYLFKGITTSTTPSLAETAALTYALGNINAQQYKWQIPGEEEFIKNSTGDPAATFYPKGELEIVQVGGNTSNTFRLAWKFDVYAQQPLGRFYIFIDAQNGAVLKKVSRLCNVDATGTATTVYRGNRTIHTDTYNGGYRLHDLIRGQGVYTYNMQTGTNYNNAVEFTDANNAWNNVNAAGDQYAGDAHWGGEMTYDFYQTMGRNSINNAGFRLLLYVHYDQSYLNAFWDGQRMNFGDGSNGYEPLTSLDITGHEISHGLDQYTANLDYQDESGGLNESFSDIFGTAVEWYADSTLGNWLIAEDIGTPFRSMSSPKTYQQPNTYGGQYWYTGTQDYGGVHTNSGVQNHWYYRVAQGGAGTNDNGNAFNVTGIGRHKATQIAWRNMVYYLTNTSQYTDARFYAIQSANDLFGPCSQEAITTTKAWYAVGVGGDFVYGVDAQFTASPTSGCQIPTTVTFTNTSSNASTFNWSFGDGGTSTAQGPTHTYTNYGVYTVKLVADGGACGVDSLTATNLININVANPCVVILPSTGSYQTQTSCTGTIYDNGGPNANYTDQTNSTVTISPAGASKVTLHFTQFAMENTYDFLYVYDGPSTASPVIGTYTGTTIPANITSSGPSITVRQSSDPAVNDVGFTIQWTCITPNTAPVANFTADVTQTCSGNVKFTDLTTGGVSSWLWDFGDGTTSTIQHPTHTYTANGTFTVMLTATNSFGNNTKTRNSYITVNKPAAPTTTAGVHCGPGTVSLSASTSDNVSWYDNSGTLVSTSNPFVTPVLSNTTTYYAETNVAQPIYHAGPVDSTIGTGGYLTSPTWVLNFRVFKNCKLVSVVAYAQTAGYRTVQQRDSVGALLQERTVYCSAGRNRLLLNMPFTPGTYRLALKDTVNLFRNNAGANYPYADADNMVSIYGNNAGANTTHYYYYLYDWELQENDCISLRSPATATISPTMSATISPVNVNCFGGSTGSASVVLTGGISGYTYSWSNSQTGNPLNNLAQGSYAVTATDAVGCTVAQSVNISEPAQLTVVTTPTSAGCGQANGSIATTVNGGTTAYAYNWSNSQTTPTAVNLAAGSYNLTVTDAHSCSATASATVAGSGGSFTVAVTETDAACYGAINGSAGVTPVGGTPNYTYIWSNGENTSVLANVAAGSYTVTVTDAGGCSGTSSVTISQPTQITSTFNASNASCGQSNGSITATASGGASGYTYSWSNSQTGPAINNLPSGTYDLTITDANSCSTTTSQVITNNGAFSVSATESDINCYGATNGSAAVTVNGGTPGYTYIWSSGQTTSSISSVGAGTYIVTITDAANCNSTASVVVNGPTQIQVTSSTIDASCGQSNGSITATVSGGSPGYTYTWSNTESTSVITNLPSGTYTLTVNDANNCITVTSATIINSAAFSIASSGTDVACYGALTGSASVNVTGGTPGYTYTWSSGGNTNTIGSLAAGTYTVTITDAANCLSTASIIVNGPATPVSSTINSVNPLCFGHNNGSITVSTSGGTPNYTYAWNVAGSTNSLSNLAPGSYSVTITDANNCTSQAGVTLVEPAAISLSDVIINVLCHGTQTGSVALTASGGTPGYTYLWSNAQTTSAITGLPAGNYAVTVTDNNGCASTLSAGVQEPNDISVTSSSTDATGTLDNGTASVDAITGGTFPYTISWNSGQTTNVISGLAPGTYVATITDANGCTQTTTVVVNQINGIQTVAGAPVFTLYPNPASTRVMINVSGLSAGTVISLHNVLGQPLLAKTITGSVTFIDISQYAAGVYFVECRQNGATSVKQLIISR